MKDQKLQAAERTLASCLVVLSKACERAEEMTDQALADDMHALMTQMKAILAGIGSRGQRYKSPSTTVRN